MADENEVHPVTDPAYIMGFSVNHYTERTPEELEEEGFSKEAIAYAKQRLTDQGLAFKGGTPKKSAEADGDPLPDGFHKKDELEAGGVTTLQQVRNLSDESLLQIPGIGKAAVAKIREQAG